MQWLFWQMGGIGPIGGQLWHFRMFAPQIAPDVDNSYSRRRYDRMFDALLETMDRRLADRAYLAGDYSIADMAAFPWIAYLDRKSVVEGKGGAVRVDPGGRRHIKKKTR